MNRILDEKKYLLTRIEILLRKLFLKSYANCKASWGRKREILLILRLYATILFKSTAI